MLPHIIAPQSSVPSWSIPKNIQLAGPNFNTTQKVDILLSTVFYVFSTIVNWTNPASVRQTVLGWITAGKIEESTTTSAMCWVLSNECTNFGSWADIRRIGEIRSHVKN